MIWATGGVLLWLGGWWFTGRLAEVYGKAIYLEEADHRQRGLDPVSGDHHRGILLFSSFDLGLLLLGIRSLGTLKVGGDESQVDDSLVASVTEWSVLVCFYLFRQGMLLHRLYHGRWRARTGQAAVKPRNAGTLKGIWQETSPALRAAWLVAPILACVPLAIRFVGSAAGSLADLSVPEGGLAPVILWFLVPQGILAIALALPLLRLRRRVNESEA